MKKVLLVILTVFIQTGFILSQADNDDCNAAKMITLPSESPFVSSLIDVDPNLYTISGIIPDCATEEQIDAWYSFQMPLSGTLKIFDFSFGTDVNLYSGSCGSLVPLECGGGLRYEYDLVQGQTYYIQAWKRTSQGSQIRFKIEAFEVSDNDNCASAESITLPSEFPFVSSLIDVDSDSFKKSGVIPDCATEEKIDAWYSFQMPLSGTLKIFDLNFGTDVNLYSGSCGSLVPLECGGGLRYEYDLVQGQTYYIQAWKRTSQGSEIRFKVEAFEVSDNDNCVTAESITLPSEFPFVSSLIDVDSDSFKKSGIIPDCATEEKIDAWYSFQMPLSGTLKIFDLNFGTDVNLYSGSCGSLVPLECGSGLRYEYDLVQGQTYYIQAWKRTSQGSEIQFKIEAFEVSENDNCATAESINFPSEAPFVSSLIDVDSDSYKKSGVIPDCITEEKIDAWYSFQMPVNGNVKFFDLNFGTQINLYSGACGSLVPLVCGGNDSYEYGLEKDQTYFIQAWKQTSQGSEIRFKISATETIENDECINALELTFDEDNISVNTFTYDGATTSPDLASCQLSVYHDGWYKFTSPITGTYRVLGVFGSQFALYEKDDMNCYGAEIACFGSNTNINVVQGEEYILRTFRSTFPTNYQFSLTPTATSVSLASSGICVSGVPVTINNTLGNTMDWIPIKDSNGDLIAAINANGNELGEINTELLISISDVLTYDSSDGLINYLRRTINITPDNQPTTPVSVILYFRVDEFNDLKDNDPTLVTIDDLRIYKVANQDCETTYDGTDGEKINPVISNYTFNERSAEFQVNSFSKFLLLSEDNINILPVKLESFTAQEVENVIQLDWATASEINNSGFDIQRSADGITWQSIGWVNGNGTTSTRTEYQWMDVNPNEGVNLYRLRQVDYDDSSEFSDIVQVLITVKGDLVLYPNPATTEIQLSSYDGEIKTITVIDLNGKIVIHLEEINQGQSVPIAMLQDGLYFIEIKTTEDIYRTKFIKQ